MADAGDMSAGVPASSESTKWADERTKPALPVGVDVGELGGGALVVLAPVEDDGGQVQHLAGGPGDPDEPLVPLDLEELVGPVVARAHVHLRRVGDLHGAQQAGVLVLEDRLAGLEEQVPAAHHGLDRDDVLVDEPQRHGVLVDHVVEEVAAGAPRVEPPAVALGPQVGLEGRVGLADHGLDAQRGRPADGPLGDQLLGQLERRVVDEALADAQGQPGVGGGALHLDRLVDRVGHRLLHRDVLARRERVEDQAVVGVGRGQHLQRRRCRDRRRGARGRCRPSAPPSARPPPWPRRRRGRRPPPRRSRGGPGSRPRSARRCCPPPGLPVGPVPCARSPILGGPSGGRRAVLGSPVGRRARRPVVSSSRPPPRR